MTDVVVRTLRLRGSYATRLARAAARELPAALERSLADLGDADIAQVNVRLDFDPDGMDDATVATLWAEAIRIEVLASGATTATATVLRRAARESERRRPARAGSPWTDAVAAARAWLTATVPRGPVPWAALRLAEPSVADHTIATIGRVQWAELVIAIDEALSQREATAADTGRVAWSHAPFPLDTSHAAPVSPPAPPDARPEDSAPSDDRPATSTTDGDEDRVQGERERAATCRIAALADLLDQGEADLDLNMITHAAGLVLLYPWLADVCREGVKLYPDREESDVRALLLATLVDPEDDALAADPLVTFLAGRPGPLAKDAPQLNHSDEFQEACERALASFASLLPGFAGSSPAFVRQQWISRAGIIDASPNPALLTAATHPLDVVLTVLPYPVALFALPWARPLSVRFRP